MATYTLRDLESGTETIVTARDDAAAFRAAHRWARGGDYRADSTIWVDTQVIRHRRGGERETIDTVTTAIDPIAPRCSDRRGHQWSRPHAIVGGLEENPGVLGHGGGVIIESVCLRCGCGRTDDTWAQRPDTGEQGLHSVSYESGRYELDVE